MIAVLRRQLVKRRVPHPKRLTRRGASARPVRPASPVKPPEAGSRGRGSIRSQARPRGSRRWITAGLSLALLLGIFVPAIAVRGGSLPKPILPVTAESVQELYRVVLPDPEVLPSSSGAAPALASLKMGRYTIKKGESLSQVASKLGLNMDTLVSFNGIRDARSLAAGTVLRYPNANGLRYVVRRGDTLGKISGSYSVPLETLADWNQMSSSVIAVGQELFIPGARMNTADLNKALGNLFVWPVTGRITSRFGDRNNPFTGVEKFHNGIDIGGCSIGTPVGAAMAGRVASVGFNNVYGKYIIIKHPGTGFQTMYAHLIKTVVSRDQNVGQGQKIGDLGNTGMVTGPHLHFSIFKSNVPVDPLTFLK